jgi:hypothetical protein
VDVKYVIMQRIIETMLLIHINAREELSGNQGPHKMGIAAAQPPHHLARLQAIAESHI